MAARKTIKLNIDGLVPDENYMIQVRTVANGENSPWSRKYPVKTIDDRGADGTRTPEVPGLTSFIIDAAGQYVATWNTVNENTDGSPMVVTRYEIELSGNAGTFVAPHYGQNGPEQVRSFNFGHLRGMFSGQIPTTLTARLRVVNSAGTTSEWSAPLTASLPVPNPPRNPDATGVIDGVKVKWEPPLDPIHLFGYRVYLSMTDENFVPDTVGKSNLVYQGGATEFTYTSLSYDLMHYFKIVSYSEPGLESTSVQDSAKPKSPYGPDTTPPLVPVLGQPTLNSDRTVSGQANLSWTFDATVEVNQDINGFVVAWRLSGDTNWRNTYFEKTARNGVIDLPRAFANYDFKIAAYDFVANYSAFSAVQTLDGAGPAPLALTGVDAVTRWDGMKLLWNHSESQAVINGGKYEIQHKSTNSFTNDTPTYTTGNRELDLSGLQPAQSTWYWRVRAVDVMSRPGPWSEVQTDTLPPFPTSATSDGNKPATAPQNIKATGGLNYINASWDVVQNIDDTWYEVYMSATNNFTIGTSSFAGRTSATSIMLNTLPGGPNNGVLAQGTPYYVKVRAMDADGDGPVSAQASAQLTQIAGGDLGINMSGENLLYNSSMEEDSDLSGVANYWEVVNGNPTTTPVTASLETTTTRTGGKYQRLVWTGNTNGITKGLRPQTTQGVIRPNTEYAVSFYARAGTGTYPGTAAGTGFTLSFSVAPAIGPTLVNSTMPVPSATVWNRYIYTFTTGATVDPNGFSILIAGHTAAGGWLEIDDVQAEAGNIASAYKTGTISIAKLATGTLESAIMTINTGGEIKSKDYDLATKKGFLLTATGLNLLSGTVNAATLQAGTTITSDLFVGSKLQVATNGFIQSANYDSSAGVDGYRITSSVIDIRSGTVAAGTLSAGTITSPNIILGVGGKITVDSTGAIQSNNYANGTTGWKISATGIEMWDINSKINVNALETGTLTSTTITIGSGGVLQSANWNDASKLGWRLNESGFTMYNGTIRGTTIITNQIYSDGSETVDGISRYKFSINAQGYAEFVGARIYGNASLGSSASNAVQSGNYNGSTGWKIMGDGSANFFNTNTWNLNVYWQATVGADAGHHIKSAGFAYGSAGWIIRGDGYAEFNGGALNIGNWTGGKTTILDAGGNGQIRFYSPGYTTNWHNMAAESTTFIIRGGWGGHMQVHSNNTSYIGLHISTDYDIWAGRNINAGNSIGAPIYTGNPILNWVSTGSLTGASIGSSGRLQRTGSSLRLKNNIRPLTIDVEKVLALEPKIFNWNDTDAYGTGDHPGFIAEEAEAAGLHDWVTYEMHEGQRRAQGFRYPEFTAAQQVVLRDQQTRIKELEARLERLEAALDK